MNTNALEISVCLCDRAVRIVEPKIYIVKALTKSELWQGRASRMRIVKTCPYHLCLVPEGSRPDRMSDVFSGRFSVHFCHSTSAFGERMYMSRAIHRKRDC